MSPIFVDSGLLDIKTLLETYTKVPILDTLDSPNTLVVTTYELVNKYPDNPIILLASDLEALAIVHNVVAVAPYPIDSDAIFTLLTEINRCSLQ